MICAIHYLQFEALHSILLLPWRLEAQCHCLLVLKLCWQFLQLRSACMQFLLLADFTGAATAVDNSGYTAAVQHEGRNCRRLSSLVQGKQTQCLHAKQTLQLWPFLMKMPRIKVVDVVYSS